MEAVIFGSGRLTTTLVPILMEDGYRVTVLDEDTDSLELLAAKTKVETILTSEPLFQDYLQQGDIDTSELFLALSKDDCQNALMAQIARYLFNVPTVVCLLENPQLQALYSELGLKVVGASASEVAQSIKSAMMG